MAGSSSRRTAPVRKPQLSPTAAPDGVSFNGMTIGPKTGILFWGQGPPRIWVIPTAAASRYPHRRDTNAERLAQFSPDGRWVTYQSKNQDEPRSTSGRSAGERTMGGLDGWRHAAALERHRPRDYWIALMRSDGGSRTHGWNDVDVGAPAVLFRRRIYRGGVEKPERGQYDVAADGRFLINTVIETAAAPITVVQHWRGAGDR